MEIKASEFKAKCLQLMDSVAATGEALVITKNGVPVAKLVPAREKPGTLFGLHAGEITIRGSLIDPVEADWEAAR